MEQEEKKKRGASPERMRELAQMTSERKAEAARENASKTSERKAIASAANLRKAHAEGKVGGAPRQPLEEILCTCGKGMALEGHPTTCPRGLAIYRRKKADTKKASL